MSLTHRAALVPDARGPPDARGALVTHTNITARKLAELHADELANHDPLTGTLNRRGFSRRLHLELARRRRRQGGARCARSSRLR
ncbi:MAG: hypothetical protein IPI49_33375 [Myxococcales bacterium]|nr:hypothetical protein [Myxococcales bacterium]